MEKQTVLIQFIQKTLIQLKISFKKHHVIITENETDMEKTTGNLRITKYLFFLYILFCCIFKSS